MHIERLTLALVATAAVVRDREVRGCEGTRPDRRFTAGASEFFILSQSEAPTLCSVADVKNVPEMIDDLAISPKLIRKHKLDRSQQVLATTGLGRRIGDIPTPGGGPIGGAGEWIWPPWPSKRSILSHEDKPLGPPSAVQIPARPRSGGAIGKLCPESSES